jgi:hypothetical protein
VLLVLLLPALRLGSSSSAQIKFSFVEQFRYQEYLGVDMYKFTGCVFVLDDV